MDTTLLDPSCDGACYDCDCVMPTASCELVTEDGIRELHWMVTGAVEAWIIKTCYGGYGYGSTETRIDLTLIDGDGEGTISPVDQLCTYTVHAENACGEVTSDCFIGCGEIDCDSVPPCQCVDVPSGLVRDNTYSINLVVTGIVRGRTFTVIGFGTFTTSDVDISGTYGFTFAREFNEFDECINFPFATPGMLILYQEFLFTDDIGRDWYAVIRMYPGNGIGSAIVKESDLESGFFFAHEYMALPLTEFRACAASCTCPTARMQTTTYFTPGVDSAFDSSEVKALGMSS